MDLVRAETTRYPCSDGDTQNVHFEMSVLEHPEPVLDIVSVLHRHPPDTNLV
ncbi:hypothetical protein SERLADRAFT_391587 [Serpula lacrymans var. lacrymans S7.9]|nr:uncharacterized protein SERLADRAFT_391587 [Serpula lacrymans var. lacrymans S7.9]EGO23521.1 hypothetical protein SERLADRAFT_391587 [Serpula lacrymans var. lacrymans S7.9]